MSSALVARLRHLESQVASLETTCAARVDVLARACETLREENEALRLEVARYREVDQTLLEGLLDAAPLSDDALAAREEHVVQFFRAALLP